jgi:hypothetical protein
MVTSPSFSVMDDLKDDPSISQSVFDVLLFEQQVVIMSIKIQSAVFFMILSFPSINIK